MNKKALIAATGIIAAILCTGAGADTPSGLTGTKLPAMLITPLSTKTSRVGEVVKATITADVQSIPSGATAVGKVTEVSPKEGKNSGKMKVVFTKISYDNGSVTIQGLPTDVGYDSAKDKSKKDTGKGAAIGAVGGVLVGGNDLTAALIGGAVGAGVGKASSKGKAYDFDLKEGTKFKILIESVTKPANPKPPAKAPK
jgi:hypothetical protein